MSYKLIAPTEPPTFRRFLKRTFALDLLKGLKITLIEMFLPKTIVTIKYPLEKIPLSPRYRAIHKLMRLLESGSERCIGCGLCEKICISNCIKIETSYGADSRKKIDSYTINFGRCIYCGFCAEVCPEIAIIHGERYENAAEQRAHFANKGTMLTPLDLALRGNIDEFAGYGALSENADENVKKTPTDYVNSSLGEGNSPLELHSADLVDFGEQQTTSLVLSPKSTKNHESQTENPSVVLNAKSAESSLRGRIVDSPKQSTKNGESTDSSLRGVANAEAIQKNNVDCHENSLRSFAGFASESRNDDSGRIRVLWIATIRLKPNLAMTIRGRLLCANLDSPIFYTHSLQNLIEFWRYFA